LNQPYFIVVVAHSLHGRIRRIHVPHQVVYAVVVLAVLGLFSLFGALGSYLRMAWKVANYNELRQEFAALQARYQELAKDADQKEGQLAQLQLYASEVSLAFGLKNAIDGPPDFSTESRLIPTFSESLSEYTMLKSGSYTRFRRSYIRRWQDNIRPSLWPLNGRLMSHFGKREDPFNGSPAFHTGVDISAATGTLVRATADGIVAHAGYAGAYGRLIVIEHGEEFQTYYAHLSRIDVLEGQEVRRGEVIGASGATGRATSPHLHYEVRTANGTPINPYPFLVRSGFVQTARRDFPF